MSETQQQSGGASGGLIPEGTRIIGFDVFAGLNTNASRVGIKDTEAYICDGFFPIGDSWCRTMPDIGAPILTSTTTGSPIVFYDFGNIGATPYAIVFTADGAIWSVNTNTSMANKIAPAGTIMNPAINSIGVSQWGSTVILIVSNQTNGYFLWDGTVFYSSGQTAPDGNPVPTGISGIGITTFLGRVWIVNGIKLIFSAPGSYTDFSTSDGGGVAPSNDSALRVEYVHPVATNGFLYLISDSAVNYVSGVTSTTSGGTTTTTFSLQNVDPQTGTPYPATVGLIGQDIVFANAFGAFATYGGRVAKTSDALDGIYATVPTFGGLQLSAANAIVFGKRIWCLLSRIVDQVTQQQINKLMCWDRKKWWTTNQSINLIFIQSQEINSVLTAWGTDGTQIVPLFQNPSINFTKTLQSKLWATPHYAIGKIASRLWGLTQFYSTLAPALTISVDDEAGPSSQTVVVNTESVMTWTNNTGATINWTNNALQPIIWNAAGIGIGVIGPTAVAQQGVLLGLTASTQAADMAILSLGFGVENMQYRG